MRQCQYYCSRCEIGTSRESDCDIVAPGSVVKSLVSVGGIVTSVADFECPSPIGEDLASQLVPQDT